MLTSSAIQNCWWFIQETKKQETKKQSSSHQIFTVSFLN